MLKVGHSVTRPGRRFFDEPVTINVPEELETVPGVVQDPVDVDYYSREYPLETIFIANNAEREWAWSIYDKETIEDLKMNNRLSRPIVEASKDTGDIDPSDEPVAGKDISEAIKQKARELGFGEVGITKFDLRYVYQSKRDWVKFPMPSAWLMSRTTSPPRPYPARKLEGPHFGTYRIMGAVALDLADYIRSFGYHARCTAPWTTAAPIFPCSLRRGWASWEPTASCCRPISAPAPELCSSPPMPRSPMTSP